MSKFLFFGPAGVWPDLRPLNDGPWSSNHLRTTQMLRVLAAYWDWSEWSVSRRQRCIEYLAIETVRQLIAPLPGLSEAARIACQDAQTYRDAEAAAEAAAEVARAVAAAAECGAGGASGEIRSGARHGLLAVDRGGPGIDAEVKKKENDDERPRTRTRSSSLSLR